MISGYLAGNAGLLQCRRSIKQSAWVSARVKHGEYDDPLIAGKEENRIRKPTQPSDPDILNSLRIARGIAGDLADDAVNLS
jgi:hypothetical protein